MDVRVVQQLLREANYYDGAIDGDAGPKTWWAVEVTERNSGDRTDDWPPERRLVAAAQRILNAMGYEAGEIDGYYGHNTREAETQYLSGKAAHVARIPLTTSPRPKARLPTQAQCRAVYGNPDEGEAVMQREMVFATAPLPLRLDWNLGVTTTRMRVHRKVAERLENALLETVRHYGEARWRELGLDRYAGGFMHRRMRGGTKWSMHAYGCATDWFAAPNSLRMRCPRALFCGEDYRAFLDIMETHDWLPAIRLWGADAMHFQVATL